MTNKRRDDQRTEYENVVLATFALEEAEKRLFPCICKFMIGGFVTIAVIMLISIACYP